MSHEQLLGSILNIYYAFFSLAILIVINSLNLYFIHAPIYYEFEYYNIELMCLTCF